MKDFFKEAAEGNMDSMRDKIMSLSDDRKRAYCYKYHMQGVNKKDLAKFFDVSLRTIYDWLKRENQGLLEEFEVKTGLELLIDQFSDLEQYEKMCMFEASHLGQSQIDVDPDTGETRVIKPSVKNLDQKAKFIGLAKDFRKMQIDLLETTGLIPKQAEKIYGVVKDNKAELEEDITNANVDKGALSETVIKRLHQMTNL